MEQHTNMSRHTLMLYKIVGWNSW